MSFIVTFLKSLYYDFRKNNKKAIYYYKQCKYDLPYISYRIGTIYIERKQWESAEYYLRKAYREKSKNPLLLYRLGYALEKQNKFIEAEYFYKKAIDLRKDWTPWKEHYIRCLTKTSKNPNIAKEISSYIQELTSSEAVIMKAKLLHSIGQFWQEAEALKYAIELGDKNISIHFDLANCYTSLKNWDLAIQEYCNCIMNGFTKNDIFYHLGYALKQKKDNENAEFFYETSISFSHINIDSIHEKYGRDRESALFLYEKLSPRTASKTANKLEKAFCFHEALKCYNLSINEYIYNCGLVSEILKDYDKAIDLYSNAINKHTATHDIHFWYFRLGYCLEKKDRFKQACDVYEKSFQKNEDDTYDIDIIKSSTENNYFPFGYFYSKAIKLCSQHKYKEACQNFRLTRVLCRHSISNMVTYNKSRRLRIKANYIEFCETQRVSEKVCFLESYSGRKMTCNPFAIFLRMLSMEEFNDWTFVWCVESFNAIKEEFKYNKRCIFVKKNSDLYLYYLATSKLIINNSTFGAFFSRRNEQLYLNTWHGTPWKNMGIDIKNSFMEYANTQRNFLHTTHLLSPNPHTTHILVDRYNIKTIFPGKVLELGYPRIDLTLATGAREKIRSELGIAKGQKLVIYMPTFRGVMGEQVKVPEEIISAAKGLKKLPCRFLFSGHYFYERHFQEEVGQDILSPITIENNELLAAADILITDYSSIAFDYMVTNKEIIYYIYDEEDYKRTRGLYFDQEILSGKKCYTVSELLTAVSESINVEFIPDKKYEKCKKKFCPYQNNDVSKKVIDILINDMNSFHPEVKTNKKALLFHAGNFNPNGITRSFLSLLHNIDYSNYDISVVINGKAIQSEGTRTNLYNELPDNIHILGFVEGTNFTIDEERVNYKFNKQQYLESSEMRTLWNRSLSRDYRRLFGYAYFDAVIQFDGYSPYWTGVFANSCTFKCIFLHNTMEGELKFKYPNLENVFRELDSFDKIVSVSEALGRENQKFLAKRYNIKDDKFYFVENTQNFERIELLSKFDIDEELKKTISNKYSFLSIGRLSIEKSHKKLIDAFTKVHKIYKDIYLTILGDGPLFSTLLAHISDICANDYILLRGYVENPYSYLRAMDCFILPSDHEGQPMVLLEAMALEKPFIASDIPANRGVVERFNYGILAENSVDGLATEIINFIKSNKKQNLSFNKELYNKNCMKRFYKMFERN